MHRLFNRLLACLCLGISSLAAAGSDEAFNRTREAALKGDPMAQFFVGWAYHQGLKGVAKDSREAAKWWRKAADQSLPEAEVGLGNLYYLADGVDQDFAEAHKWFRRAAMHGELMSCVRLSTMYLNAQGVPKDLVKAYAWLSVYRPSEESNREKKRQYLLALENQISASQLLKAQTMADELREEIRSSSK